MNTTLKGAAICAVILFVIMVMLTIDVFNGECMPPGKGSVLLEHPSTGTTEPEQ